MSDQSIDKNLAHILSAIISDSEAQIDVLFAKMLEGDTHAFTKETFNSLSSFNYHVTMSLERFVKSISRQAFESEFTYELEFLLLNASFVKQHFDKIFQKIEGTACCADKARSCTQAIFEKYAFGRPIAFNYQGEYTFHLPQTILQTEAEILLFYQNLRALYLGEPMPYLNQIAKFHQAKQA